MWDTLADQSPGVRRRGTMCGHPDERDIALHLLTLDRPPNGVAAIDLTDLAHEATSFCPTW
jgi:hypothetical protein